jgi:hypothetical protein
MLILSLRIYVIHTKEIVTLLNILSGMTRLIFQGKNLTIPLNFGFRAKRKELSSL